MEANISGAVNLSVLLATLENKFGVCQNKVHMLSMIAEHAAIDMPIKVTAFLKRHQRTSRATTHRMLKELVSNKLVKEQADKTDGRVKYLLPGSKFPKYVAEIGELL